MLPYKSGEKSARTYPDTFFSDVVDEACDRLKEKHVEYSINRIHEMEEVLTALEQELDHLIVKDEKYEK